MTALNRVAVLCGGTSSEHPVSLKTGATMVKSLLKAGFEVTPIVIGKDGTWSLLSAKHVEAGLPKEVGGAYPKAVIFGTPLAMTLEVIQQEIQVVVIGLHGPGGEDGTIQGFLETAGLAYTGPGVTTSAVAMDKVLLKELLRAANLPTADWIDLGSPDGEPAVAQACAAARTWARKAGYPVVVKARTLGSSVGIGFAADQAALDPVIRGIAARGAGVFVEKAIKGIEVSCGVVGRGSEARSLPAIEIVPKKGAWFDFESKYAAGGALERIPARIPKRTEALVQTLALAVHALVRADGITRTDMIVDKRGPWILETNTLPGMTETSLVPRRLPRSAGRSRRCSRTSSKPHGAVVIPRFPLTIRPMDPSHLRRLLITDRALAPVSSLVDAVVRAVDRAALTMIVLRELDLAADDQVLLLKELAARVPIPVMMARSADLALRSGAAGVQLGWGSPSVVAARHILGMRFVIGASVHSVEEGLEQAEAGADYLLLGPIFPTPKRHGLVFPIGTEAVRRLTALTKTPVVAVGGIDASREREVLDAGAAGIAAIRAFMAAGRAAGESGPQP